MAKQLLLFNTATSAYFSGNQAALEENMEQFAGKVKFTQTSLSTIISLCFTDEKSSSIMDRAVASRKEMTKGDLIFTFICFPCLLI